MHTHEYLLLMRGTADYPIMLIAYGDGLKQESKE